MHRYATEIVANHFVDDFASTLMMDMHADSGLSTQEVGGDVQLSQAAGEVREGGSDIHGDLGRLLLPGRIMTAGKLAEIWVLFYFFNRESIP